LADDKRTVRLEPNPGPQSEFLSTPADIAFYGGAAGGGKSYAVLLDGLRWRDDPDFGGIIFRREAVDLIGAGSIWDMAQDIYPLVGARSRENPRDIRFPSGGTIEFAHLQHEKDKLAHQGKQYSWISFEELTHFTETQFWYMVSRKRTKANMRAYVRATCNPDPDSFVAKMVAWWIDERGYAIPERSGVIRYFVRDKEDDTLDWADTEEELLARHGDPELITSFTFILSRLKDNPKIDRTYRGALLSLPLVERERLLGDEELGGNWKIRPVAGNTFKRHWFRMLEPGQSPPFARKVASVRWWDKASTAPKKTNKKPDWTVGVRVDKYTDGTAAPIFVIEHVERLQNTPGGVNRTIRATAELDGIGTKQGLWEDPGSAGAEVGEAFSALLSGFANTTIKQSKSKLTYADLWSPHAERGRVYVRRGTWNDAFFAEAESFPDGVNDDQVDGASGAFLCLDDVVPMEFTSGAKKSDHETSRNGRIRWGKGGAL
jgi:predicted phage terminase large subunit-like protein